VLSPPHPAVHGVLGPGIVVEPGRNSSPSARTVLVGITSLGPPGLEISTLADGNARRTARGDPHPPSASRDAADDSGELNESPDYTNLFSTGSGSMMKRSMDAPNDVLGTV
jgi:hypothetical protein